MSRARKAAPRLATSRYGKQRQRARGAAGAASGPRPLARGGPEAGGGCGGAKMPFLLPIRQLDCVAVIESCPDGTAAMQRYRGLHQQYPAREFYFVHTSREDLDIRERQWIGIRSSHAVNAER
jgi:hypothetical protein